MKTLVVATDFSIQAHWATDYALQLAHQLNARLVVVHAYDPLPSAAPSPEWLASTTEGQYYQALHRLSQLREQLLDAVKGTVEVSVVARPDAPGLHQIGHSLLDEAHKLKADLLVMGMVGDHPQKARQLGSLATDLISQASLPILLVPPGYIYHRPGNMVLAVDLSEPVNAVALDAALRFARSLQTTIDVVCVGNEPTETERLAAQHLRDLLRHQPHTFSFIPGYDVAIALDRYLAEHPADLLMMLPRHHNRLETWLLESITQEVARTATLPVLTAV